MHPEARRRARRSLGAVPLLLLTAVEVERASDVAERRLTWVVYGLLALAALISVATVLFWRATRPDPAPDPEIAMRWINPADAAQRAPQPPERRAAPGASPPSQVARPAAAAPAAPGPAPRRRPPDQTAIATLAPRRRPAANGAPAAPPAQRPPRPPGPPQGAPRPARPAPPPGAAAPPGPDDRGAR